jgi:hypothetical protein
MGEQRVACPCGRVWKLSTYALHEANVDTLTCECGRPLNGPKVQEEHSVGLPKKGQLRPV